MIARRLVLLLVFALGLALPAAGPATAATGHDACTATSWVAGTVDLCEGSLIYRDYVYDDYGADLGPPAAHAAERTGSLAFTAGDVRYVGEPNTADLVDLTLRIEGDRLEVTFEMNALFEPGSTIAALAIDTDNDAATGGGEWAPLTVSSTGWDELHVFDGGDPDTNLISGDIPLPPGSTWRLQAVTAEAAGEVMNVAFRGPDEEAKADLATMYSGGPFGVWFEDLQSEALTTGDISRFGHVVDVADLLGGVTRPAEVGPGLHERVYTSDYTLPPGEGMSYEGIAGRGDGGSVPLYNQIFHFYGKYQPYGIYVPDQSGPHGVQFIYHGSNTPHASLINQPGVQQDLGDALNRILVVPLARGPHGYGSDISERDVLDVYDDVISNLDVDPDRVFAGGYSQGGYITFRTAALHPHLFAGFISWVGFTGDAGNAPGTGSAESQITAGAVGNARHLVRNLRHVPGAMLFGGTDELIHASSSQAMAEEFRARDFPYIFYFHPTADHFTFAALDEWSKEAAWTRDLVRVENPPRVVYRTDEFLWSPDYGIRHDTAYWLSRIRPAGEGYADLDVTSYGCGGSIPTVEQVADAGPAPVPWVSDSNAVAGEEEVPRRDRIEAELANVESFAVDVDAACLARVPIEYRIVTEGPTTIGFSDGRSLVLSSAGTHEGVLPFDADADDVADAPAEQERPPLPTTGQAAWLASLGGLLLLAASRRRR